MANEVQVMPENKPMFDAAPANQNLMAASVSTREAQIIQGAIVAAKMYPRDRRRAFDSIIRDCQRPTMAEVAMYAFPRGGQTVSGPSIRLAEMVAQNWGNIRFGFQEQRHNGYSDVIAYCWDIETNTYRSIDFTVKHWRDTKGGGYALDDERDIYEMVANQAQRRVRGCILAVLPGDVIEAAELECERTMTGAGDLQTKQGTIVKVFGEMGVSIAQLEKRLGKLVRAITHTEVTQLQKIYRSLKDGMSKTDDWFEFIADPEKIKTEQKAAAKEAVKHEAEVPNVAKQLELDAAHAEFAKWVDECRAAGVDPQRALPKPMAEILLGPPANIRAGAKILKDAVQAVAK